MSREFKRADYDQTLELKVRLGDCLPLSHLARFVVDCVAQIDLSGLYARYGTRGGVAYAPEVLLGLLFYGLPLGCLVPAKLSVQPMRAFPSASSRATCIPTTIP